MTHGGIVTLENVRVAARTLRKQPAFSIVVIASLALAISLNTTMYAMLDALIHPRVDIRDPSSLYRAQFFGDYHRRVGDAQRDSLLRTAPSIESIAWYDGFSFMTGKSLRVGESVAAEAPVGVISREYFEVMQPRVITGRTFVPGDEFAETKPMVIGDELATRLFKPGANPLGERVFVGDEPYVVIGVLSKYADFPEQHSGFIQFNRSPASGWVLGKPGKGMFVRVVRARPGVTRDRLQRDLDVVAARIAVAAGESPSNAAFRLGGITKAQVHIEGLHLALASAVFAILLVACANVANMQLARGIGRSRELALRAALGATRRRIVVHLLTESVVLATVGLALGLVLTYWFGAALHASIPPAVGAFIVEPKITWRVLAFALAATVACIVMVGLVPAIRVSRVDPNEMLKSGAGTGASRRNRRQYAYLVVVEIAFALALLCATAVTIQSALAMDSIVGYDPTPIATGRLPMEMKQGERRSRPEAFDAVLDVVRGLPGVTSAAVRVSGEFENRGITLADSSGARSLPVPGYGYLVVSPAYFRTFGLPIIRGRDFHDGERDQGAVIIDEYTAKKLWPNANPIGALVKLGDERSARPFVRVVGVVGQYDRNGDIKPMNMADASGATIGFIYYLPSLADSVTAARIKTWTTVFARTNGDAVPLATAMRRAGVAGASSMTEALGLTAARATQAFMSKLFVLFGALGLCLAAFGVYGVVAHSVAERRRELGVRIALGATSRDILHAVLREKVVVGLSGIAVGLWVTASKVRLVGSVAYAGDVYNAPLFALVAAFMFGVAALAAYIPARRATRVDPTESLRSE
jgi:putative ABC transport system permease protein